MADRSAIEWCDSTFNPWIGCTRVSPACDHCYAAVSAPARVHGIPWGAGQTRHRTGAANWKIPLRWNANPFHECAACGWRGDHAQGPSERTDWNAPSCPDCGEAVHVARRRVFCASLADVFDNEVDPQWRRDLFALIHKTTNLDWLLLTKRIGNVLPMIEDQKKNHARYRAEYALADDWLRGNPPANVWLGATICNQQEADRDIPKLLATPAMMRFVSIEPMLGALDLSEFLQATLGVDHQFSDRNGIAGRLHWVIAGGESGTSARPMDPSWVYSLRDQCEDAEVAFLFKQWGEWHPLERLPVELDATPRRIDPDTCMVRIGKKAAGRLVDGIEHNEFPSLRPVPDLVAGGDP